MGHGLQSCEIKLSVLFLNQIWVQPYSIQVWPNNIWHLKQLQVNRLCLKNKENILGGVYVNLETAIKIEHNILQAWLYFRISAW